MREENLDTEHEERLRAEAETRVAQPAQNAKEGPRRTEEARVARLGEMHRLLVTDGAMED